MQNELIRTIKNYFSINLILQCGRHLFSTSVAISRAQGWKNLHDVRAAQNHTSCNAHDLSFAWRIAARRARLKKCTALHHIFLLTPSTARIKLASNSCKNTRRPVGIYLSLLIQSHQKKVCRKFIIRISPVIHHIWPSLRKLRKKWFRTCRCLCRRPTLWSCG